MPLMSPTRMQQSQGQPHPLCGVPDLTGKTVRGACQCTLQVSEAGSLAYRATVGGVLSAGLPADSLGAGGLRCRAVRSTGAILETPKNIGAQRNCRPSSQGTRPPVLWEAEWSATPPVGNQGALVQRDHGPGTPGSMPHSNMHSRNMPSD